MNPARIIEMNVTLLLCSHLLLNEDKRNLVEEIADDGYIISNIYDYYKMYKPKLRNMKTFVDISRRNVDLISRGDDNLLFAILKNQS